MTNIDELVSRSESAEWPTTTEDHEVTVTIQVWESAESGELIEGDSRVCLRVIAGDDSIVWRLVNEWEAPSTTSADGFDVYKGSRVFDYYNGVWVFVDEDPDNEGWFSTSKENGQRGSILNGDRVTFLLPETNPFYEAWRAGYRGTDAE